MKSQPVCFIVSAVMFLVLWAVSSRVSAEDRIDFNRDVRPILSNHCWSCHGPDEQARQAKLRLDVRDGATAKLASGEAAIVAGNAQASELVRRITADGDDEKMPPLSFKRPLSAKQKDVLKKWIDQGAAFARHWAYEPPQRPALPDVKQKTWPLNPIDQFVMARLERESLAPASAADKGTWLRRVTLDLTGLPPSLAELDAFLADGSASAYEAVVDRLLRSPRHAERMAMQWLDVARFADTNGYNNDETRTMWPWRDWVIRAYADNLPYDQFLTQQLAGDLLPNATIAQKVATGFVRNHVLTTEGGIIEEEYHVEYVADRVHTTATVFLAMSMQCARCHDHKFDPVTQRDFYRFAAYFNNVPDKVVKYSQGRMAEPLLKVPSPEQERELAALAARKTELETAVATRAKVDGPAIAAWERSLTPEQIAGVGSPSLVARFALDDMNAKETTDAIDANRKAKLVGDVKSVAGKIGQAFEFQGGGFVDAGQIGEFEADESFTLAAWVKPQASEAITVLSKMDDANGHRGYDLILESGKVACHIVHQWPAKGFKVVSKETLPQNEWRHLAVVYDGSRQASGVRIFIGGKQQALEITTNNRVDGTLKATTSFHIGKRGASAPFRGAIDDVQVFRAALAPADVGRLAAGETVSGLQDLLAVPAADRTPTQQAAIRHWFLERVDDESRRLRQELSQLPAKTKTIEDAIPVTMVMGEKTPRRPSYILKRGAYDQRGEEVSAGVPVALLPLPEDAPNNRLGLAQWLTRSDHPLTARVAVNRWWEMFFGSGLVETTEDFGIQGSLPSHPELLDWLATELVANGWNQRAILKQIVLSATYRQTSHQRSAVSDQPNQKFDDPHNRLLARGPRFRLSAETLRDSALFVSGLLNEKIGGPSVKPYQPDGLWEDVSVERREKYQLEPGDGIYRRSLYTFWKRTCPPPTMSTFDAPDRETCTIRRARTNTPLQALVLLNDPTFVEAARKLAERVLASASAAAPDDTLRLRLAFRSVLSREPSPEEMRVLTKLYADALARFRAAPADADKLLSVGRAPRDPARNPVELAAWSAVCSMLFNLSEAVTKP